MVQHINKLKIKMQGGQLIIELLVAFGLASVLLPSLLNALVSATSGRETYEQRIAAVALLKEGEEAMRSIREGSWSAIATNGTYYPKISGTSWILSSNSSDGAINGFTRSVLISSYVRNGTVDPSTKQINITVSWPGVINRSVASTFYLTRYSNAVWFQTTVSDFTGVSPNLSTLTNTQITNNAGGEVQLANGVGGWGNWCAPNLNITGLDLTRQGVPTAISASYGHAYTANGINASGDSLDSINISDPPAPAAPVATEGNYYNNFKSNGLYADSANNRVYLTTSHPNLTVDIVSTTTFQQVSTFKDSGGQLGDTIYVANGVGYVTTSNNNGSNPTLYIFDTTKIPGSELGHIALAGVGKRIIVINNIAYVATSNTTAQLQVFDVSNPASIKLLKSVDVGNGGNGVDLSVDTTSLIAYLVTNYISSSVNDVFSVNLTTYGVTGLYNTSAMNPDGVAFIPGGWLIVIGANSSPYQVFDLTKSQTNPCGTLASIPGATTVYSIAYIQEPDGDVFSYILTDNASQEFDMIAGGPGGAGGRYFSSGTFESDTFTSPTGNDVVFNSFGAGTTLNGQTISFQVAGAHMINGSCTGVTFTYTPVSGTSGPIPLSNSQTGYVNPAGCFRYKATFYTNNASQSPVLNDMSINYSP